MSLSDGSAIAVVPHGFLLNLDEKMLIEDPSKSVFGNNSVQIVSSFRCLEFCDTESVPQLQRPLMTVNEISNVSMRQDRVPDEKEISRQLDHFYRVF